MTLTLLKNSTKTAEENFSQKTSIKIKSFSTDIHKLKLCLGMATGKECKIPLNFKDFPITENVENYDGVWFEYDLLLTECVIEYELK